MVFLLAFLQREAGVAALPTSFSWASAPVIHGKKP